MPDWEEREKNLAELMQIYHDRMQSIISKHALINYVLWAGYTIDDIANIAWGRIIYQNKRKPLTERQLLALMRFTVDRIILDINRKRRNENLDDIDSDLLATEDNFLFTLIGVDKLTPKTLAETLSPYLQAVFDLQGTISKILDKPFIEPRLRLISQNSPIEVNLTGVAETGAFIRDELTPWRRDYSKKQAELDVAQKEQTIDIDAIKLERELIALEKDKLELQQAKIDLVLKFVDKIASGLSDTQRIEYTIELLKSVDIIVASPLEVLSISVIPSETPPTNS